MFAVVLVTFITVSNLFLGLFVLFRNVRSRLHQYFAIFALSNFVWSFSNLMTAFVDNGFWIRMAYAFGALLVASGLVWFYYLIERKDDFIRTLIIYLVLGFFFFSSLFTSWIVKNIDVVYFGRFDGTFGPLFSVYTFFIGAPLLYIVVRLFIEAARNIGIKRQQLFYVGVGASIFSLLAISSSFLLPIFGINQYSPIDLFGSFIFLCFITYTIVRYRLVDIRLVASKIVQYILIFFTSFLFIEATLLVYGVFDDAIASTRNLLSVITLAILAVLLYNPFQNLYSKLVGKLFYRDKVSYQSLLKELGGIISKEVSQGGLVYSVSKTLSEKLKVKHSTIYILQDSSKFGILGSKREPIETNYLFTKKLNAERKVLITEELEWIQNDTASKSYYNQLQSLIDELNRLNIALASPIIVEGKLVGMVTLGRKRSGDVFTAEDVEFLDLLSPQLATALERAKLFDEAKQFNIKLKKEVDQATEELRKANIHLKQLDQAKSEFLSIAAHQLRTPITGIKGYTSMFLEGDFGSLTPEQSKEIRKIFNSSDRLARLVDVFLNVSRIESGRFELKKTKVDFVELLEEVISTLEHQAEQKNINLTVQKPTEPIPRFAIDRDKIHDVMMNLIDNAIKYTQAGGDVNVRLDRSKTLINFQVKDNGMGISAETIDKLFQKFSRANVSSRIHTGGSGLGLYIAKKIVEAHGGRIWVESDGEGKGASFFFTLPISDT